MIRSKVKVLKFSIMVTNIKANLRMIKEMEKESLHRMKLVIFIKESGKQD